MPNRSKVVFVAEDDPTDQMLLNRAFKKAGIENPLVFFRDGAETIDFFSSRTLPDLNAAFLLLDLKMPRVDGFAVLKWFKEHDVLRRLPVIVLTSSDVPEDVERAYAIGASSYLRKPSNQDDLAQMVEVLRVFWLLANQPPQLLS